MPSVQAIGPARVDSQSLSAWRCRAGVAADSADKEGGADPGFKARPTSSQVTNYYPPMRLL